jgi:LEA14-like dessication related protein
MKKILIGGAVLAVAGSLYMYYKNQVNLLQQLSYTPVGVRFDSISLDKAVVMVQIRIDSNSRLEALIERLSLDIYLNGFKAGHVTELKPLLIPAKGYSIVNLKVEFSPKELGQNIVSLAGDFYRQKDMRIGLKGEAKVKSSFIRTTIPVDYTTTVKELMTPAPVNYVNYVSEDYGDLS